MPIHIIEVTCKACGNSWPKDRYEELRPVDASLGWCPSCGEDGDCVEQKDAEIARLRSALKDLLEASHHTSEMDYLGDNDPWDKAEKVLEAP